VTTQLQLINIIIIIIINTQHSQQTDGHDSGGTRTRIPSKRAAADPRLRLRSNRYQLFLGDISVLSFGIQVNP